MARFCPLFSSSSGNSTLIATSAGSVLVDAGVSFKQLCRAIEAAGSSVEELSAIAVTHEHSDHVKGLKTLLKNHPMPLIGSPQTLKILRENGLVPDGIERIPMEGAKQIAGLQWFRFPTSHDCDGSSGYVISLPEGERVAVCTDLGTMTETVRQALSGCKLVLLESNHDIGMLQKGPYPLQLKMRILSEQGHLSNASCAEEIKRLYQNGTTHFILGHLSEHNNLPMLAFSATRAALLECGASLEKHDYFLTVAKPFGNEAVCL